MVDSVAPLDSTVLLYGESGSGKEVFTRYIHEHSGRKDKPFIAVNCAAFPENLIEAELFGYEKGSFTGANREGKAGLAEAADGGTLFLDEINSLPLSVQGKVLRMIEEKSVQRIGAIRAKKVDFRLIAATNRDLYEMVREGTFREDLYYRLHVIPLTIPPVRSRQDDIMPL
ncbi:Regulatory protein LuxO [bioreactor metagenome]|uniref:Regulatory protein LuxO n=1 Tax=bioreactor metagenome TaxID=1076179 RepID=A0A644YLA0_9ZZZZ